MANLLEERRFKNYWFATGTPTFLLKVLSAENIDVAGLERKEVSEPAFDCYEIEALNPLALLFQTGYLSIIECNRREEPATYILSYPNREVKISFLLHMLEHRLEQAAEEIEPVMSRLKRTLKEDNAEAFASQLRSLIARIPYTLHIERESYYHSLFYVIMVLAGEEIEIEVLTDRSRIDGVMVFEDRILVMEFKYGREGSDPKKLASRALDQIRERNYEERYRNTGRRIISWGLGFTGKELAIETGER